MQFSPVLTLSDVIYALMFLGTIVALFYRRESDLKDVQKDIAVMRSNLETTDRECASCKKELKDDIERIEKSTSEDYREMSSALEKMEKGLRDDINSLRKEIIDILKQK